MNILLHLCVTGTESILSLFVENEGVSISHILQILMYLFVLPQK